MYEIFVRINNRNQELGYDILKMFNSELKRKKEYGSLLKKR